MNNKNNESATNICGNKNDKNRNRNYKILVITIMIIIVIMIIDNSNLSDIVKMMGSWKQRNAIWHLQEKPKKPKMLKSIPVTSYLSNTNNQLNSIPVISYLSVTINYVSSI